ncbi:MAG: hypothetical protein KY392_05530 [Chloroflexi bacterium]|nr:hypothetical protein [Chloroflexota bacterium]
MIPILALCLALGVAVPAPPRWHPAVPVVPEEPGVVLLPDRPTLQVVVADFDRAGRRGLVRLVANEDGSVDLEAWRHDGSGWRQAGEDLEVVPAGGNRFDVVFDATPARLLVRRDGARERVTLVRQPRFEPPELEPRCCLQLHDLVLAGDDLALLAVGSASGSVDSILALDLDADGTDELLASRSLRPLGRTAYPSQALVFRWRGEAFSAPTLTELPVGSGDTPFVLGETDGRPGDEAGVITTAARGVLYRIVLDQRDRVRAESAGTVVHAVTAAPFDGGPGVAVVTPLTGLSVHRWPSGEPLGPALGTRPIHRARLIGGVGGDSPRLFVIRDEEGRPTESFGLPKLDRPSTLVASPAARTARLTTTLRPYRGPLPGGGPDGEPAILSDGLLVDAGEERPTASLPDAEPVGLAGPDGGWLALAYGTVGAVALDRAGGRLGPPDIAAWRSVALVPAERFFSPEVDDGLFAPPVMDAHPLDADGTLGIPAGGFGATVVAPPGSRVHAGVGGGSTSFGVQEVEAGGRLQIRLPLPRALLPYGGERIWLAVATPAGASYVATWRVLALTGAPPLEADVTTPLGSTEVVVRGTSVRYASVEIDGRAVEVGADGRFAGRVTLPPWPTAVEIVATDPVGNVARVSVAGIGLLDYRTLPWIPIAIVLVAAAAVALYVRVPRPVPRPARVSEEDGVLEDLDTEPRT